MHYPSHRPVRLALLAGLGLLSAGVAAADEAVSEAPPAPASTSAPASSAVPAPAGPDAPPAPASQADPAAPAPSAPPAPAAPAPSVPTTSAAGQPGSLEDRVRELESTIRALQETIKNLQAKPADPAQVEKIVDDRLKSQKPAAGWNNGFFIQSQDGNFRLRLHALIQADERAFTSRGGRTGVDSAYLRRVRPIFDGTLYKYIDFRLMPDFAGNQLFLTDAYLDFRYYPQASLRVGKFKEPVSLERLQGAPALPFIERSIGQNLAPNRDVGAQLYGDLFKGSLTYYAGAFNGVNDGGSIDADVDNDKDFAGRLFYQPFKNQEASFFHGLGVGVGASIGERRETLGGINFRTAGRSSFFRYQGPAAADGADGTHTRIAPGFYFYKGGVGLMGEYISSKQEIQVGAATERVSNHGWFLLATYVLTGERASFDGVAPRKDFDPRKGTWGAFELGARYSRISFDDVVFRNGLANPALAVGSANELTLGLNWYLNRAVKVQLNYVRTDFDRALAFGANTTDHEDVFLSRVQLSF